MIVHYDLLNAISNRNSTEILEILERCLTSKRFISGYSGSGYPLRYAAAWGFVYQANEYPEKRESMPLDKLQKAAESSDGRLAMPALIALAMCGAKLQLNLVLLDRPTEGTFVTAAIVSHLFGHEELARDHKKQVQNSFGQKFLNWLFSEKTVTTEDWNKWEMANGAVADWIENIVLPEDGRPAFRKVISVFTQSRDLPEDLFPSDEFRRHEIAKTIPVITMSSMFRPRY